MSLTCPLIDQAIATQNPVNERNGDFSAKLATDLS